jgi:hypothetical protein
MSTLPSSSLSSRASSGLAAGGQAPAPALRDWRVLGDLDGNRVYGTRDGHLAVEREHAVLVEMTSAEARRWWRHLRQQAGPFPAW